MNDRLEQQLRDAAGTVDAPAFDATAFAARAAKEGLADVAYTTFASPVGELLLAITPRGLVRIAYADREPAERVLEKMSARISPRVLEAPGRLDEVRRQLDAYFAGRLHEFDLPLDWTLVGAFGRRVLGRTARIPYGRVATYGEVARDIGSPRAARAAGNALGGNPIPIVVPCHRVVRGTGALGGYGGGPERKEQLLTLEGGLLG